MMIPHLVMIYQPWMNEMSGKSGKAAPKKDLAAKIGTLLGQYAS